MTSIGAWKPRGWRKVRTGEVLGVSRSNPAGGTVVGEYRMKIPGVREVLLVPPFAVWPLTPPKGLPPAPNKTEVII